MEGDPNRVTSWGWTGSLILMTPQVTQVVSDDIMNSENYIFKNLHKINKN